MLRREPDQANYEFTLRLLNAHPAGMLAELKAGHAHLGCRHAYPAFELNGAQLVLRALGRNPSSGSLPKCYFRKREKDEG